MRDEIDWSLEDCPMSYEGLETVETNQCTVEENQTQDQAVECTGFSEQHL